MELEDADDMILEALEEHHIVKWTLSELQGMSADDERFEAKVTVLMESVRHPRNCKPWARRWSRRRSGRRRGRTRARPISRREIW